MEYKEYFPQEYGGGLATMGLQRNGIRTGAWSYFNVDGSIRKTMFYDDSGKLHGVSQTWYSVEEGGGSRYVSHWEHGIVDGLCEMYDPLSCGGGLIFSATYRNGALHGPLIYFTGTDTVIENYDNGKPMTRIHHKTPVTHSINVRISNVHVHENADAPLGSELNAQIDHICALAASDSDDGSDSGDSSDGDLSGGLIASVSRDDVFAGISSRDPSPRDSSPRDSSPRDSSSRGPSPRDTLGANRRISAVEQMEPSPLEQMQLLNQRVARLRLPD